MKYRFCLIATLILQPFLRADGWDESLSIFQENLPADKITSLSGPLVVYSANGSITHSYMNLRVYPKGKALRIEYADQQGQLSYLAQEATVEIYDSGKDQQRKLIVGESTLTDAFFRFLQNLYDPSYLTKTFLKLNFDWISTYNEALKMTRVSVMPRLETINVEKIMLDFDSKKSLTSFEFFALQKKIGFVFEKEKSETFLAAEKDKLFSLKNKVSLNLNKDELGQDDSFRTD